MKSCKKKVGREFAGRLNIKKVNICCFCFCFVLIQEDSGISDLGLVLSTNLEPIDTRSSVSIRSINLLKFVGSIN